MPYQPGSLKSAPVRPTATQAARKFRSLDDWRSRLRVSTLLECGSFTEPDVPGDSTPSRGTKVRPVADHRRPRGRLPVLWGARRKNRAVSPRTSPRQLVTVL